MKEKLQKRLPAIGLRIIKSAIAVELCFLVSFIRGNSGIVFYSHILLMRTWTKNDLTWNLSAE